MTRKPLALAAGSVIVIVVASHELFSLVIRDGSLTQRLWECGFGVTKPVAVIHFFVAQVLRACLALRSVILEVMVSMMVRV